MISHLPDISASIEIPFAKVGKFGSMMRSVKIGTCSTISLDSSNYYRVAIRVIRDVDVEVKTFGAVFLTEKLYPLRLVDLVDTVGMIFDVLVVASFTKVGSPPTLSKMFITYELPGD